jgi:uncharacterized membrane protein YdjX (TVP38/TMEM64 family)
VARAEEQHDSLIAAVESLRRGERTLEMLDYDIPDEVDKWVPESAVIDPEKPVEPEELLNHLVGAQRESGAKRLLHKLALPLAVLVAMALLWRFSPLSEWLSMSRLEALAGAIRDAPFSPLLVILAYLLAGFLVVPLTLLIVATVTVFGPWEGGLYALAGAEASALATFGVGHMLGRDTMRRLAGSQLNSVTRFLSRRGVITVATLRLVPVAPFTVVNLIAGVSSVRFRDFAIGSVLGLVPGIVGVSFLADRIIASLRNPSPTTLALLALAAVLVVGLGVGLRRWVQRRRGGTQEKA